MAINKVNFGDETLIDLTEDSVTADTLLAGATAHNRAGEIIEGTHPGGTVKSVNGIGPDETGDVDIGPGSQGEPGLSGIYYGTTEPTAENHPVWIDPSGEGDVNIGGGGGAPVQPDWNQNGTNAPDYVKNRPFYETDPEVTIIMPEETLEFSDVGGGLYVAQKNINIIEGTTYTVNWDGDVYSCVCRSLEGTSYFGNMVGLGLEDTGEPFGYVKMYNDIFISYDSGPVQHTVLVSTIVKNVIQVPLKYLPIATDDDYGLVKKDNIVELYSFSGDSLSYSKILEATERFNAGKARINIDGNNVSYIHLTDDGLFVGFANTPFDIHTYSYTTYGQYFNFSGTTKIDIETDVINLYSGDYNASIRLEKNEFAHGELKMNGLDTISLNGTEIRLANFASTDNGKVLGIANGRLAWVDPLSTLPTWTGGSY